MSTDPGRQIDGEKILAEIGAIPEAKESNR
jgi:hypothetical protein